MELEKSKAKNLIEILEKDLEKRNNIISKDNFNLQEELSKFSQIHIFSLQIFLNGDMTKDEFTDVSKRVEEHIQTLKNIE